MCTRVAVLDTDLRFISSVREALTRFRDDFSVQPVLSAAAAQVLDGGYDVLLLSSTRFHPDDAKPMYHKAQKVMVYNGESGGDLARMLRQMVPVKPWYRCLL